MPTPVPAPKKVMAHRAVRPRLNTSDAASPIIAPAPELRTTRSSNVSQRALMMSSLGSDFFAGGAFLAASSAMVSTYALRRRRAVARCCEDRALRRRRRKCRYVMRGPRAPGSWVWVQGPPLVSELGLEATTCQRRAAVWMKVFKRAAIGP
uniref:Uncharacterized protein n=1 Tax=Pelagomonas calceolata TaxID=35677 RepID=A0A7S4EBH2_9STRA|mmetsp:Transcript_21655/g.66513  ORF Transcript_21655/g.66513 Transcript_21655/m.66513 type:complete len:151 (-) Transcript_21655:31-483(-)